MLSTSWSVSVFAFFVFCWCILATSFLYNDIPGCLSSDPPAQGKTLNFIFPCFYHKKATSNSCNINSLPWGIDCSIKISYSTKNNRIMELFGWVFEISLKGHLCQTPAMGRDNIHLIKGIKAPSSLDFNTSIYDISKFPWALSISSPLSQKISFLGPI